MEQFPPNNYSFSKRDLINSLITGFTAGFVGWRIFIFLNIPKFHSLSHAWLIVFIPVLWVLGVNLGYLLGKKFKFFNQFGRFAAVGFTGAAIDFGVLNLLIFLTGFASGVFYALFKLTSFVAGATHNYIWHKYWSFDAWYSNGGKKEIFQFVGVVIFSSILNAIVASSVVNFIHPLFGLDANQWANIGAVAGGVMSLLFNFTGFKKIVFKK